MQQGLGRVHELRKDDPEVLGFSRLVWVFLVILVEQDSTCLDTDLQTGTVTATEGSTASKKSLMGAWWYWMAWRRASTCPSWAFMAIFSVTCGWLVIIVSPD